MPAAAPLQFCSVPLPTQARAADSVSPFPTSAFGFPISAASAAGPPDDIQYMPPGRHTIHATRDGEPVTVEVEVDQQTAQTLDQFLRRRLALAAQGLEDRPYFDLNHDDREASAWPVRFYWAGSDPKTGGVRAKVEWTGAGVDAIDKRTFRRFSPTFHVDDATGRVTGSETNMGGLVNRAAFKRIAPLFARAAPLRGVDPSGSEATLAGATGTNFDAPQRTARDRIHGPPDIPRGGMAIRDLDGNVLSVRDVSGEEIWRKPGVSDAQVRFGTSREHPTRFSPDSDHSNEARRRSAEVRQRNAALGTVAEAFREANQSARPHPAAQSARSKARAEEFDALTADEHAAIRGHISEALAAGYPVDADLTDAQRDALNSIGHRRIAALRLTDAEERYLEHLMDTGADPADPRIQSWIRDRRADIADLEGEFGPNASFDAIRDFIEDLETTDSLPHGLSRSEADAIIKLFRSRIPARDEHGAEFVPPPTRNERSAASGGLRKLAAFFGPPSTEAKEDVPTPAEIERAAAAADPRPSDAQKKAGNYAKGHILYRGLDVTIENPRGSVRSGVDADGTPWTARLPAHYGYIRRTEGADGDQVDVYLGDFPQSDDVFVIDQINLEDGEFDEHKVILGAASEHDALNIYNAAFSDGRGFDRVGGFAPMTFDEFREWIRDGDHSRPADPLFFADNRDPVAAAEGDEQPRNPGWFSSDSERSHEARQRSALVRARQAAARRARQAARNVANAVANDFRSVWTAVRHPSTIPKEVIDTPHLIGEDIWHAVFGDNVLGRQRERINAVIDSDIDFVLGNIGRGIQHFAEWADRVFNEGEAAAAQERRDAILRRAEENRRRQEERFLAAAEDPEPFPPFEAVLERGPEALSEADKADFEEMLHDLLGAHTDRFAATASPEGLARNVDVDLADTLVGAAHERYLEHLADSGYTPRASDDPVARWIDRRNEKVDRAEQEWGRPFNEIRTLVERAEDDISTATEAGLTREEARAVINRFRQDFPRREEFSAIVPDPPTPAQRRLAEDVLERLRADDSPPTEGKGQWRSDKQVTRWERGRPARILGRKSYRTVAYPSATEGKDRRNPGWFSSDSAHSRAARAESIRVRQENARRRMQQRTGDSATYNGLYELDGAVHVERGDGWEQIEPDRVEIPGDPSQPVMIDGQPHWPAGRAEPGETVDPQPDSTRVPSGQRPAHELEAEIRDTLEDRGPAELTAEHIAFLDSIPDSALGGFDEADPLFRFLDARRDDETLLERATTHNAADLRDWADAYEDNPAAFENAGDGLTPEERDALLMTVRDFFPRHGDAGQLPHDLIDLDPAVMESLDRKLRAENTTLTIPSPTE
ncbi:MAG: hypothetical protein JJU00_18870 [Opitutales bacterium]|nr:hypothetical protein [Opitutales bacterium]